MEQRSEIVFGIRNFFRGRGFFEAETPVMVASPDMEPHLSPFATELQRNDGQSLAAHLITSPEYSLKKLLAGGYEKVFELARCFRNGEPWNSQHNPEFTMLEWYRSGADYTDIMRDTEELTAELCEQVNGSTRIEYDGRQFDLAAPWQRLSVGEAFDRHTGLDLAAGIDDPERFIALARDKGYNLSDDENFDDTFYKIFLSDIEPQLGQQEPVILYDFPRSMAALARLKPTDHRFAERFEVYVRGIELCNAFSELTDPAEQEKRFLAEQAERQKLGLPTFPLDKQLLTALQDIDQAAGIALGVDRLVMLLTDAPSIENVLFFPAKDIFSNK